MPRSVISSLLLPLLAGSAIAQNSHQYNNLAVTPQMGWDNWNAFGCAVSHDLLTSSAKMIKELSLQDLGYEYVILDDCWSTVRDPKNHSIIPNFHKFPGGMKPVADDLHAMGFKFGMYSSAGAYTCGKYPGSLHHEQIDAQNFASWGVDYLKYDNCYNEGEAGNQLISHNRYKVMSDALNATGRPILYSLCNWGEDFPWNWGSTISNSWRITGDVYDSFDRPDSRCPCDGENAFNCELPGFHCSVMNIANKAAFVVSKAQPGGWNDMDMLTVGLGAMTDAEYVAHFSLWSAAKSPLLMGNDFTKIKPKDLTILNNPAVIAVNQDPAGSSAARRTYKFTNDTDKFGYASVQMWSGNLNSTTGGDQSDMVVLLINGQNSSAAMTASLADIFVDNGLDGTAPQVGMAWEVRDLWANRMSDAQAQAIINKANSTVYGNGTDSSSGSCNGTMTMSWYNATETSYAEGLKKKDERLLGKVTTTVQPSGTITATVDRHGAAMFRLRAAPTQSVRKRSEL